MQSTKRFSIPNYCIKKGRPHGHRYGKKPAITNTTARIRSKRNARRRTSWVFMTDSSATRSSARTCLTSVALKKYVVKWTTWRTKTNWWIRSNTVGSDTMPVRHRLDFKQALSTLRQLKNQEDTAHQQRWQSYFSSWWNWQESWWHSSSEHHHDDGPSTD